MRAQAPARIYAGNRLCYDSLMIKGLDRYVLKEIASPFAVGLSVYTSTLLINQILILSKTLIAKGATAGTIFRILLYLLPDFLAFTIPMATLMGVLAGMSRMSSDSEIIALRTMGVRNRRLLRPVLLFSAAAWLVSSFLIMFLAPEGNYRFNKLYTQILLSQTVAGIKPGVFYQGLPFYSLYFADQERDGDWRDVLLYSMKKPEEDTLLLARNGRFLYRPGQKENHIVLRDGVIHSFKKKEPSRYALTFFAQKTEPVSGMATFRQTRRSTQLVLPELLRRLRAKPGDRQLSLELHKKFALPFACLALGFLGLSLGISTRKGGKTSGFVISLGVIFAYYVLMTAGRNLIVKGIVSPFWGSWAPTLFLLALGAWLYRFSSLEKEIHWERLLSFQPLRRRRGPDGGGRGGRWLAWSPVKILDLYVLRRLLLIFALVLSSLLLVFYIVNILELVDNIIENGVPFRYLLRYNYFVTPEIFTYILPIAILTAVLLAFSLMSKNNEVVAVQVSGVSLPRLALPALFLGLAVSLAVFFLQERVLPEANRGAARTLDVIHKRQPVEDTEYTRNWVLGQGDRVYFYDFYEKKRRRFVNFNVIELDGRFRLRRRLSARSATWKGERTLLLRDGFSREFRDNLPAALAEFAEMRLALAENRRYFSEKVRFTGAMNSGELRAYIRYLESKRSDPLRYRAQLYNNYAFPFSSLVMVFIAIPFSFLMGNRGALFGIGIAVGVSVAYWGALGIFNSLGTTGALAPLAAAFAPLALFTLLSAFLFARIRT